MLQFLASFIVLVEQYPRGWCHYLRSFIYYDNVGIGVVVVSEGVIADVGSNSFDGSGVTAGLTKLTLLKAGLVLLLMT